MQASDLPSLRPDDLRWQQHAACRSADTALFFPDTEPGHTTDIHPEVRALCQACPVHADCLDYALANHERGIWAATTPNDRKRILNNARKQRQRDKRRATGHGTVTGYLSHTDAPCPPCRAAYERAQEKRQRRALA